MVWEDRSRSATFPMGLIPAGRSIKRRAGSGMAGIFGGPALYGFLELRHLGDGEMPELPRFQRTQIHRADFHALEFFHQQAEVFEHHSDLIFAAFEEPDLIPGILRAVCELEAGGRGAPSLDRDSLAEGLFLLRGQRA